jgi:transcriptional regulator with XRE-family HTH domain
MELIRRVRLDRGMRLADLAKASGVSVSHLSRIENGVVPRPATLKKIAKGLGVDYGFLRMFMDVIEEYKKQATIGQNKVRKQKQQR